MNRTRVCIILWIVIAGITGGCESYPKPRNATEKQDQRAILNEGYSILYNNISNVAKSDLILMFKFEADTVGQVVNTVADYAGKLKNTLERIAEEYPAVDLKLEPLPTMEQRTRDAVMHYRIRSLLPFIGLKGMPFNRRMLQSLEGPLNQIRFLCQALADEEPEPNLKRELTEAKSELDRLYDWIIDVLNEQYYQHEK